MEWFQDPVFLSRVQYGMTSAFHYIYPPLSIGLGLAICFMEAIYLKTKKLVWQQITRWWIKVFALTFALGVATGIVQLFGFGTNWAQYSRFVGDVFGSALGAEGIFAFFLESGFLGLLLFGWNRLKPGMHFFSAIMVCLGAHFSAVWIVVANAWMQTPTGYIVEGVGEAARARVTDFWAMVLNPSSIERLVHVILGCWISGALLVTSIAAYYLLKQKHREFALGSMKIGLVLGSVALLLQLVSGHSAAEVVAKHQPTKLAAMEGIYRTGSHQPISLFGWVDEKNQTVHGPQIPGLLSYLGTGSFDGVVQGLNDFPPQDRPPVQVVYQSYHLMVQLWGVMTLLVLIGLWLWRRGCLCQPIGWRRWWLRLMMIAVVFPQLANFTGWMTAEVGRQPWVVYGVLRTTDGVTKGLSGPQVLSSLITLALIYCLLFVCFIYLIHMKVLHGPEDEHEDQAAVYRDPFASGV